MKLLTTILLLFSLQLIVAQPFNSEIIEEGKAPKLLGKINMEGLSNNSYQSWFDKNFEAYTPDAKVIEKIGSDLNGYRIELFMGTWCGDSKREVPRFYKVLEAIDFPLERLSAFAVDNERKNYKQSPGGEHEGKNIHRVPTFIIYKDGAEINRIVESPVKSLEEDLYNILQGEYVPNYEAVHLTKDELDKYGSKGVLKRKKKLTKALAPMVDRVYDLNTFATVLMTSGKTDDGVAVARLNLMLFPENAYAYASLANKLSLTGENKEAMELVQRAIELDPEDERYKELLESLQNVQ